MVGVLGCLRCEWVNEEVTLALFWTILSVVSLRHPRNSSVYKMKTLLFLNVEQILSTYLDGFTSFLFTLLNYVSINSLIPESESQYIVVDFTLSNARQFYSSMVGVLGCLRCEWVNEEVTLALFWTILSVVSLRHPRNSSVYKMKTLLFLNVEQILSTYLDGFTSFLFTLHIIGTIHAITIVAEFSICKTITVPVNQ